MRVAPTCSLACILAAGMLQPLAAQAPTLTGLSISMGPVWRETRANTELTHLGFTVDGHFSYRLGPRLAWISTGGASWWARRAAVAPCRATRGRSG